MTIAAVEAHHWSRDEYHRLASSGLFLPEQRMELITGSFTLRGGQALAALARPGVFLTVRDLLP